MFPHIIDIVELIHYEIGVKLDSRMVDIEGNSLN